MTWGERLAISLLLTDMVRLRLFGGIELRDRQGRDVRNILAQPKRLALLAYLAAASPPGPKRRDTLLGIFWPDLDEEHARNALSKAAYFLRRYLGEGALVSHGAEELVLDPTVVWTDVRAFRQAIKEGRLEEALDLFRGDLLPSFFVPNAPEFEQWLDRERASLRSRAALAARTLAERQEALHHPTQAVRYARQAVDLSQHDERPVRWLIELLDRVGDRAGALQVYREFAKTLEAEFEATPSPDTIALIERVRRSPDPEPGSAGTSKLGLQPSLSETDETAGARLSTALSGRYKVERKLGAGSMAIVLLAHDLRHHRRVAIKLLRPELSAHVARERFLREIDITSSLVHPHILPAHDSGEVDGLLYYVMPYVDGESLRDLITRQHRLPVRDAVRIGSEVADALAYAHHRGFVHRDIKPENILLAGGHALVADFGIARAISVDVPEPSIQGPVTGTPAYMSPEQVAGDGPIDERTDIYALGCILHEMLTGGAPLRPEGFIAAGQYPVPGAPLEREDVPPGMAAVIVKALAGNPADRWRSAAEFGAALTASAIAPPSSTVVEARPQRRSRRLWPLAGLAAGVVALLVGVKARHRPATILNPNLIAVAPFEVLDPELQIWREGLVDVVSGFLEGTGPLRAVAPTRVIQGWSGHADRVSAEALARRTGAAYVVFGSLIPQGGASVALRATLLHPNGPVEEMEIVGRADDIGALADSVARRVLQVVGRQHPIGAVRGASLGGRSLPALKAFLRGEQYYREGRWDSALANYSEAIKLDSMFALPYQRMALVQWWDPASSDNYLDWTEYAKRAESLNAGLTPRDSLLVVAFGRWAELGEHERDAAAFGHLSALKNALDDITRRFSDDPVSWYLLGEFRNHLALPFGVPIEDQLQPFLRAIELDSLFAPAYEHAVELASGANRPELARRLALVAASLHAGDADAGRYQLDALLLNPEADLSEAERLIATAPAVPLRGSMRDLAAADDSAEWAVRIARVYGVPHRDFAGSPEFLRGPEVHKRMLASRLAERGHLREAAAVLPSLTGGGWENPFLFLALLGAVPASAADRDFRRLAQSDSLLLPSPQDSRLESPPQEQGLTWWLARGDTTSLERFVARADSIARSQAPPLTRQYLNGLATAGRAYQLLLRGDSAGSLRGLESLPDSLCWFIDCRLHKLTHARLLAASGRNREALEMLHKWLPAWGQPVFTIGLLEEARLAERLGERVLAVRSYRRVVRRWRNADPTLQSYVTEARGGLTRLSAQP